MTISISILSSDFYKIAENIELINQCDVIEMLHLDVMDGVFVDQITFGAKMVDDVRKHTDKVLDVHLMVQDPFKHIQSFVDAGSDIITVHFEAANCMQCVDLIRSSNKKAGLAIKPSTDVTKLSNELLSKIDLLLIMSVEPGYGGQSFKAQTFNKIRQALELRNRCSYKFVISVDGGVNQSNAALLIEAGVEILTIGSYLYKNGVLNLDILNFFHIVR